MRKHIVRSGECMFSIARRYGFTNPMAIYEDPANASLRRLRPDPHILHPGDEVAIPAMKPKTVPCETGRVHAFVANLPRKTIKIALLDGERKPLEGVAYKLLVGKEEFAGETKADGVVQAQIDARATSATLSLNGGPPEPIGIGHLNPMQNVSDGGGTGVQARLRNLGYAPGPVDGDLGPRTRAAIRAFQREHGMEATGEISGELVKELERAYGH